MRRLVAVLVLTTPLAALAGTPGAPVIGGADAPAGKWPDVAAVNFDGQQGCSGTLIAPTIVLTAGHCYDKLHLDSVLVGATSLARPQEGEKISVIKQVEYDHSQTTEDLTVLILDHAATMTPRKIASGWARVDIKNGAQVSLVGYGAVDRSGPVPFNMDEQYINELQEATTTITDADCTTNAQNGCNALAMPAGELGAGGMGIDTCPGDSGGPLYLGTDYGTFLAGVTSRSYDNAIYWCSEGGIYARPDKVVDWIETAAGVPIARGPEPTFDPMVAIRGHAVESMIVANDPKSTAHTYEITTPPVHGTAKVREDGRVRVCTQDNVVLTDSLVVTITDTNDTSRKLAVTMPITITDGDAFTECDLDAYGTEGSDGAGGGCCDSRRSAGGSLPLAIGVLALLRRRRR